MDNTATGRGAALSTDAYTNAAMACLGKMVSVSSLLDAGLTRLVLSGSVNLNVCIE